MKSRLIRSAWAITAALTLVACNALPLPQDVASVSTVDIVKRMRCEAADGIRAVVRKVASHGGEVRRHVDRIVEVSAIGFDVEFMMTENNSAAVTELTFQKDYNNADDNFKITLSSGWNNKPEDKRMNTRKFRVIDNLRELRDLSERECLASAQVGKNLAYPLSGSTGMEEVVRTYIQLELLTDLDGVGTTKSWTKREMVTFSERLAFATTLDAGVTVDLAFKSQVGTIKLTKANFGGAAQRIDAHRVHVVLARDGKDDPDLIPERGHPGPRAMSPGARIASKTAAIAEIRDKRLQVFLAQRSANARNRVLFELERARRIQEDRAVVNSVLGTTIP